jgi:16S rRNA (guanine527-N7)-methyltransferase
MTEAEQFSNLLSRYFCCPLTRTQVSALYGHYRLLTRWNKALNLTTVVSLGESVLRHYCESLFLGAHLPAGTGAVLDVGSGGGFPGVPVAVLRSECNVTLAESHQRKAVFLREATRQIPNIRVEPQRAEQLDTGAFGWVVARAVNWSEVIELAHNGIALLLGQDDAVEALRVSTFNWQPPVLLPWGKRRVLVIGGRV